VAAVIANQPDLLQRARDHGHGGPGGAEHHRGKFLRERKLVAGHAIVRHQEPAGEPLLDRVDGIARRGLRDEPDQRPCEMGDPDQRDLQRPDDRIDE
jgi:hypothetical protein